MKNLEEILKELIREELSDIDESSFPVASWSSPEARKQVDNDLHKISKLLGKTSQAAIRIMMSGVKAGKYDAMDLSRGIKSGDVKLTHEGEREFIRVLWLKVREGFRRYSKQKKLR